MQKPRPTILLLGVLHFLVDYVCTAALTASLQATKTDALLMAVLYNGIAFAGQLPIGALADFLNLTHSLTILGCVLVPVGSFLSQPLLLCCILGLGNACFHVGGGREALNLGHGNASPVGKFVAPGAIGIFLGPLSATRPCLHILSTAALVSGAVFLCLSGVRARQATCVPCAAVKLSRVRSGVTLFCMFLTVLLRSYMGTVTHYSFQSDPWFALLFTLCIFSGKFFGGILADRLGAFRFMLAAQLASTALFALSLRWQFCAMPACFLFHTSMATTAASLYRTMPHLGGTMFGLTTFALYLGVLPRLFGWPNLFFTWWGLLLIGLLSALSLLVGLHQLSRQSVAPTHQQERERPC